MHRIVARKKLTVAAGHTHAHGCNVGGCVRVQGGASDCCPHVPRKKSGLLWLLFLQHAPQLTTAYRVYKRQTAHVPGHAPLLLP